MNSNIVIQQSCISEFLKGLMIKMYHVSYSRLQATYNVALFPCKPQRLLLEASRQVSRHSDALKVNYRQLKVTPEILCSYHYNHHENTNLKDICIIAWVNNIKKCIDLKRQKSASYVVQASTAVRNCLRLQRILHFDQLHIIRAVFFWWLISFLIANYTSILIA